MTALADTDVTITVEKSNRVFKHHRNRCKIVFGDGALTYPAGGVPLPAFGKWGMKRNLDYIALTDSNDAVGIIWKFDQDNKKLRGYVQGYAHATGGAVTMDDYPITAADGVTSGISVSLTTGAGAATAHLGGLVELATGATVSAQALYCEAVGF